MKKKPVQKIKPSQDYDAVLSGVVELLDAARRTSARAVNSIMTATYWEVGRRIVEFEQGGQKRAEYGEELLARLGEDLVSRFGRGYSRRNLQSMRQFYLSFPPTQIRQTLSAKSTSMEKIASLSLESSEAPIVQTASAKSSPFALSDLARAFRLPWSHYVLLISHSRSPEAFAFYHTEALRGGWSVRQLRRQMDSQFYERTALSKNKAKLLKEKAISQPEDALRADEEIKDPLVLEFLGLKDEYSESDLEDALVRHLEHFLSNSGMTLRLSLGNGGSELMTNGIGSTCFSFTGGCVAWS